MAGDAEGPTFEQSILDNLAKAGIQIGRRNERIMFATLELHAGTRLQAIGERRTDDDDSAPSRIGIAIGPQYGTVSPAFIKEAAREAIRAEDVDVLCVLGFAFDPQATGVTEADGVTVDAGAEGFAQVAGSRRMGRIPVLFVRMNADLLMGEDLAKTGAGNLFTVFGEPDIDEDAWASLHRTTSRPFDQPDTGKIAVKVINDYGDEVMKVFKV